MGKFKKKPVVIEAIRWNGESTPDEIHKIMRFMNIPVSPHELFSNSIVIHTLEGDMRAEPGDWIIKGIEGEFYPCKDSIFKESYEQVDW